MQATDRYNIALSYECVKLTADSKGVCHVEGSDRGSFEYTAANPEIYQAIQTKLSTLMAELDALKKGK
jgi:hypothetical protein